MQRTIPSLAAGMVGRRVAILGPDIDQRHSLTAALGAAGCRVTWVADSFTFRSRGGLPARPRLRRGVDRVVGTRDAPYLDYAIATLDSSGANTVVAYWGTIPLADIVGVGKVRPALGFVLMPLCHPLSLTATGVWLQNVLVARVASCLRGVLYPSDEMADYFSHRVRGFRGLPSAVLPPCWPAAYQAQGPPPPTGAAPNLIFAGRTDLASSTANAADDVRPLLGEVLAAGIDLHYASSRQADDGHPHRKPFPPESLPTVIARMGSHDASLIAYNTAACGRTDRFRLTVPDRLITSVAAGVPVALPLRGYDAMRSYLKRYPALIEFESAASLAASLANRPAVAALRAAAWESRQHYAAECHGPTLASLLGRLR